MFASSQLCLRHRYAKAGPSAANAVTGPSGNAGATRSADDSESSCDGTAQCRWPHRCAPAGANLRAGPTRQLQARSSSSSALASFRSDASNPSDRLQQLLAMAERCDADTLEIVPRKPAQQRAIDIVG